MEERPILFNGDMVRAVLGGRKTQTRRVVKKLKHPIGEWLNPDEVAREFLGGTMAIDCPYGKPGDHLWVRETWMENHSGPEVNGHGQTLYRASWGRVPEGQRWKPSIHMPRWACRTILEVANVRLERLQDITEEDAESEGIQFIREVPDVDETLTAVELFEELWDSINDKRGFGWATNPWVWVVEFKAIAKGGVG